MCVESVHNDKLTSPSEKSYEQSNPSAIPSSFLIPKLIYLYPWSTILIHSQFFSGPHTPIRFHSKPELISLSLSLSGRRLVALPTQQMEMDTCVRRRPWRSQCGCHNKLLFPSLPVVDVISDRGTKARLIPNVSHH